MIEEAHDLLIKYLKSLYPINEELCQAIKESVRLHFYKKKTTLLDAGKIQKDIYFIISGGIRTYYIDKNNDQTTSWLLFEGDVAISVYSFFAQCPSFEVIETIEDSCVLTLKHEQLTDLYKKYVEFNYIGRVITEQYYIKSENKANDLRMLSAKDRYYKLLEIDPKIIKRVPLHIISSYLGITQSTLSRIRASK